MRQADIIEGQVYDLVDNRGRNGVFPTGRKVRVEQKGISRKTFSSRLDGIRVTFLKEDANGNWVDVILDHSGEPHQRIVQARELMGEKEFQALREKEEQERMERERRQAEMREFQTEREVEIAKRLACSRGDVTVFGQRMKNPDGEDFIRARSASITGSAVEEIMQFDPDAVIVQGALEEIPWKDMSAKEIAEHVIGALRGGNGNDDDS